MSFDGRGGRKREFSSLGFRTSNRPTLVAIFIFPSYTSGLRCLETTAFVSVRRGLVIVSGCYELYAACLFETRYRHCRVTIARRSTIVGRPHSTRTPFSKWPRRRSGPRENKEATTWGRFSRSRIYGEISYYRRAHAMFT